MLDKVLQEAKKWIGYLEKKSNAYLEDFTKNAGSNNYTIFAKQYKEYFNEDYQAQPWCAMYVSCVFRNALGKEFQKKIMPHFAYCPTGVNQFKKMGCWYKDNPQIGDIIFFTNSEGRAGHVGIVYNVDSTYVYTIEGNTSSGSYVIANGGAVVSKKYSKKYNRILGYGRPNYLDLNEPWEAEFLNKLVNKGCIVDKSEWGKYTEPVSKKLCLALIDKITGGTWKSEEADSTFHWAQPHVISLCGKKIITDKDEWLNNMDCNVSKALVLALVDKATGGVKEQYKNIKYDHWARANLNSLCDKEAINTPKVWDDDFEGVVTKGNFMALVCKAFNI